MKASLKNWRGSPRKFVPYLRAIKNKNAIYASEQLKMMPSSYAQALSQLIKSAVANAVSKIDTTIGAIDPNILVIEQASVGRGTFLKRVRFCGRGKVGRVTKFASNVDVILKRGQK